MILSSSSCYKYFDLQILGLLDFKSLWYQFKKENRCRQKQINLIHSY